jgi:hypothetical protein
MRDVVSVYVLYGCGYLYCDETGIVFVDESLFSRLQVRKKVPCWSEVGDDVSKSIIVNISAGSRLGKLTNYGPSRKPFGC